MCGDATGPTRADGFVRESGGGDEGDEARGVWLVLLRRYLLFVAGAHLAWEVAHLPLYTLWATGTAAHIAWFLTRCTVGDALVALGALVLALLLANERGWPARGYARTAALATALGLAITLFSEWFNTAVSETWAYSELMPVIPGIRVGLSPVAQWLTIPPLGFWWARRALTPRST